MEHLYERYRVTRADGRPTDQNAMYFVLRLDTDSAARAAMDAYANTIEEIGEEEFADEIRRLLRLLRLRIVKQGEL